MYLKERFDRKFGKEGLIPENRKVVITEHGLDHWLA